jgi:hypothetical protein
MEECALGMGQNENDAAAMDAQKLSSKEECALDMEQRGQRRNVAVKGVQIMQCVEECARGTGQMWKANDAALKIAHHLLRKEECA